MLLGALIDLGFSAQNLKKLAKNIGLKGIKIQVKREKRQGLSGVLVKISGEKNPPARNLSQIIKLLKKAHLPEEVLKKSISAFELLARAEAKIHSQKKDEIHFHELGAVDTIIDIVGTFLGFYELAVEEIYSSKIALGYGTINCAHGKLPCPAPATLELLKGAPVLGADEKTELTTPTGAVLIKCLVKKFTSIPEMTIEKIGCGLGEKKLCSRANVLRIVLGKTAHKAEEIWIFESTIDDMNPQFYQPLIDKLFQKGALEVALVPVYLKKNRPGIILRGLCRYERLFALLDEIFLNTTTTGIRYWSTNRIALEREMIKIQTKYGKIRGKKITLPDGTIRIYPEYEDLKTISEAKKIPLPDLQTEVMKKWQEQKNPK